MILFSQFLSYFGDNDQNTILSTIAFVFDHYSRQEGRNHGENKVGFPRERIGYDNVYEYLVQKNYWDIKLYEYSQTINVVRC